jgi:hypothetical protein
MTGDRARDPNDAARVPCCDDGAGRCLEALLLGAACCADGNCALCREAEAALARCGFDELAIAERQLATWFDTAAAVCPRCGCAAPDALDVMPRWPRFLRRVGRRLATSLCAICGDPVPVGRRRFCGEDCRIENRRRVEGVDVAGDGPVPRVYRVS